MFKSLGYSETNNMLEKLKVMYSVKCIEQGLNYPSDVQKIAGYINNILNMNDTLSKYLNIISNLKQNGTYLKFDICDSEVESVIETLLSIYGSSTECTIVNSKKLQGTFMSSINIYDFLLQLNTLLNYLICRSNVKYTERVDYSKLDINTIRYAYHIDMEPEFITDEQNLDFIQNIMYSMGYDMDCVKLSMAKTCDDYILENTVYYDVNGNAFDEYSIILPNEHYAFWTEKEKRKLHDISYSLVTEQGDEGAHLEIIITEEGKLIILTSEYDFLEIKFIKNFIDLIRYCEEIEEKYKK